MTTTKGVPRPDHIAELTRGTRLPLDPVREEHLSVIFETISCAWHELRGNGTSTMQYNDEAEVNALLDPRLNHYCQSQPLWKDLVHSVHRGRESISYDGSKLELRPDLSFILLHGNRNFPIAVECKIIDHPNSKTVGLYCTNGIARFVCGDYAWANREAIMLAYVRDDSSLSSRLIPHLAKNGKLKSDPLQTASHPQSRIDLHPTVQQTVHERSFSYLASVDGNDPGPISLFHLWL
ncbi:hypothetical protein EUU23_10570 [Sphingorhabdus sp. IMCC26285]|uniref:Restriction endonuclease n=1 Tax=Sphingorhabdus profundilacus TaxID=2509718 RepID=A0A6I4M1P7_9SPHN|nr:hypothetical protein [Sphingorhabdus profundilacus]MVZ98136.1 hypothetical protein [Sphingorhabdus profundilacus]